MAVSKTRSKKVVKSKEEKPQVPDAPVKDNSKNALAASKAKEVIDMGYHSLLPIDKLWLLENANSRENVFSVQFSKEEDQF